MQILTISGKANWGKDTVARAAATVAEGFALNVRRFAFAWPLKARAYALGMCEGTLDWRDIVKKEPAVRKLLQEEGTERGRQLYGDDFWVYHVEAFANLIEEAEPDLDLLILSDARFVNEVKFAKSRGAAVYVTSDRPTLTGPASRHLSEVELDEYVGTDLFDLHIDNHLGITIQQLEHQIFPLIEVLEDRRYREQFSR